MKKITLLIMLFVGTFFANAQVVAYGFSQSSGTYTEITGGTALGSETVDDQRFLDPAVPAGGTVLTGIGFPIGFNFTFNSEVYDRFGINANGWICLGKSALGANAVNINTSSAYTPLSSTVTTVTDELVARIGGLARDLQAQAGCTLRFEVSGTTPNQVLTIQWKNYRKYGNTGDLLNFQIKLYETTNQVQVVYGTIVSNTTSGLFQVGLRGAAAAVASNFTSRTSTTSWASTTGSLTAAGDVTMTSTNIPASGLTFTWAPPACPGAVGLTTTGLTSSNATITWNQPIPAPSAGYEYVVSTTNTIPTAAGTVSATNVVNLTGLPSNTIHYVFVRSSCGASVYGNWVLMGTFRTLCNALTEFVETFDSTPTGAGNMPSCWDKAGTGNVYNTTGSVAPMSPANRLYMNVSATTSAFALMPQVSNLQAETHRLKFKVYASVTGQKVRIGYFTNPADLTTYVPVEIVDVPSTAATATEFTVIPYSIPVGVARLVFSSVPGVASTLYIDDVKWEENSSCVEPTALNVLSVTNATAQLSWVNGDTETEWQIQYGVPGFTLGAGTIVTGVTTNPYTLTGLTANTNYQYYVRSVCSVSSLSSWSGPYSFKTTCNDVTDFYETFDTYTSGTNNLPDCWGRAGSSISTYITTGATAPMSPSNRLYMFASGTTPTEGYAILPSVSNLQDNTHRLRFKAYSTINPRNLIVGYMTNNLDVSTFVPIQTLSIGGTSIANTQEFVVVPTAIPAGIKNLVLKNPGFTASSATFYIDDVAWETIPACSNPTTTASTAVTSNSATISWVGNPTDVSWQIEYGAPGFTLGTGTVVAASTNPFTVTSLASQTAYQYYVRAICAGPLTSANSFSNTFTTLCAPYTPDYIQNFSVFPAPCWSRADAGTIATGPTGTGTSAWTNSTFLNAGGTAPSIRYNLYQGGRIGWMVSPIFDLSAGGYQVRYDVGATVYLGTTPATMGSDDQVDFLMSTNGGTTWTSLEAYNAANTPTNVSVTKLYSLAAVTSPNVLFAFRVDEGPTDDPQDYDFFVDNFKIDTPATTVPTCASNVVATQSVGCGNSPIVITWNSVPTTLGYRINAGTTPGGTDIANNVDLGSVLTYTYTAANPSTTYYYKIIPYNGIGPATGCVEQNIVTPATVCACVPVYTYGVSSSDYFSSFALQGTTLNYNSGSDTAAPAYHYYSGLPSQTATLTQGAAYTAEVTVGYTSQGFSVWIDFDDNGTFSASERVGSSTTTVPTPGGTFGITIPCTATPGIHRMRVRMNYSATGNTIDPCADGSFGEVEDYSITIAAIAAPTATSPQVLNDGQTVANIAATGTGLVWYSDAAGTTIIPTSTVLVDGTTYYVSQTVNGCVSATTAVVTQVVLGTDTFNNGKLVVYPNPVKDVLNLDYSSEITKIQVMNMLGQEFIVKNTNSNQTQIDMSSLATGTYLVKVTSNNQVKTIKVVKQ